MRYPQSFVDELKRQANIVSVIQDYITLKKKGSNWMACCPFHKEKSASFSVSPSKEIFYCFGCHKGGSVFTFVMEIERVGFPEAIKLVAEKSGVPLPKLVDDSKFEAKKHAADEVIQLNEWAMKFWRQQLETSKEGNIARQYILQRELSEETCQTFQLGYAPDSWDALLSHLRQKGASQAQIDKSGLIVATDNGKHYDRFRGRLIIPVLDIQGKPIAFGGRTLKNEDAKYINSPETPAYIKGRHLFGLNHTRDEIRRAGFAILVEGFFDLITPYQFGIHNVIASLGTALTPEQARLIARFANKTVVNYDGDNPGIQAAKKAIEMLLAENLEVKVLVLPDGADPDEFLRKRSLQEYQYFRGKAQPHIQFVIDQATANRNLSNPAEKESAVNEVLPFIRAVPSRMQKREYFDIAMDSLRISNASTRRELWASVGDGHETKPGIIKKPIIKASTAELQLLEFLIANDDQRLSLLTQLDEGDYAELPTAGIFRALILAEQDTGLVEFEAITKAMEGDEAVNLLPSLFMGNGVPVTEAVALKCLNAIRLLRLDVLSKELRIEMATAERQGDQERRDELSNQHLEIAKLRANMLARPA